MGDGREQRGVRVSVGRKDIGGAGEGVIEPESVLRGAVNEAATTEFKACEVWRSEGEAGEVGKGCKGLGVAEPKPPTLIGNEIC